MKRLCVLLALVSVFGSGCGQASDTMLDRYGINRGEPSAGYPTAEPASGAHVVVPAEHRLFMVQITSKQTDLEVQLAELTAARDALQEAAKSVGDLTAFRVADPSVSGVFPRREKDARSAPNGLMIHVGFKPSADALKQMGSFVKAVGKIKPPAGALWSISLSGSACALSAPEKYRAQLVAKAMDDLRGIRAMDTSRFRVTVTGLEKPLVVAQCSDSEFMVSLPYAITVESVSGTAGPETPKP
jgi:hypothetical protein